MLHRVTDHVNPRLTLQHASRLGTHGQVTVSLILLPAEQAYSTNSFVV